MLILHIGELGTNMGQFEVLIDKVLIHVPTDLPYLSILMRQPEGRYIIFGLLVVVALLLAWLSIIVIIKLFWRRQTIQEHTEPSVELNGKTEAQNHGAPDEKEEGFSFFKKDIESDPVESSEDPVLLAIEQEMLAVRKLYTEGHLLREVYVAETRRLFEKAKLHKA